jgi:hypothetical protein
MPDLTSAMMESIRQVDEHIAGLEAKLRDLKHARDVLRSLVSETSPSASVSPRPADAAPSTDHPVKSAQLDPATLLGRMAELVDRSAPGTSWKAVELARTLHDGEPTRSQIESCRAKAGQLVARGALVKNPNGTFAKPGVGAV